jgi:hypothetical protein
MKYLNTYENFFKKVWNKIEPYLTPTSGSASSISWSTKASWNRYQIEALEKYGKITEDEFEYDSMMNNLSIKIKKTYIEDGPGFAPASYKATITDDNDTHYKTFDNFNDVEKFIKNSIPEEEIAANTYNL